MNRKSFIRRIEVQIGIIMGVIMFSVLGVFLGIKKGEKGHENVVITKVVEDTSDIIDLNALEQAPAEVEEEQIQSKAGTVARVEEKPLAKEAAAAPVVTSVSTGVTTVVPTPPAEMPTAETPTLAEQVQVAKETPQETPPPPTAAISLPTTHTVKANDTLSGLARKYYGDDSKWPIIYEVNRLSNQHTLMIGQKLTIPSPKEVKAGKQIVRVSARAHKASPGRAHRVQQGDTLYELARTYYGDESQWKRIYNANPDLFSQKEAPEPGDILIIP